MDPLNEKPEKIAFIAYNIGIYESIQKFASLILAGKIDRTLDTNKIAELLSETVTFYDADMISQLINVLIGSNSKSPVGRVHTDDVNSVIDQLKACWISLP
jgi:formylmethanofuran dehydrogenase subunit B